MNCHMLKALIEAVEASGFSVSGPTDVRAAEHGEPAWVCNARAAIAKGCPVSRIHGILSEEGDWDSETMQEVALTMMDYGFEICEHDGHCTCNDCMWEYIEKQEAE